MPLYEYECPDCQHEFEKLVTTAEPTECPACHGKQLQKLMSVPSKPPTVSASLPTACNSSGPPCGPRCARF